MFNSTMNRGFQLDFDNGYQISVQWGYGNYCHNNDLSKDYLASLSKENALFTGKTAEVAVFYGADCVSEEIFRKRDMGWISADEVAEMIVKVKNLPKKDI